MSTSTQPLPLPRVLKEKDVMERTGIARGTLAFWRHAGTGPRFFRINGRVFYKEDDIAAWLDENYHRGKETDIT